MHHNDRKISLLKFLYGQSSGCPFLFNLDKNNLMCIIRSVRCETSVA